MKSTPFLPVFPLVFLLASGPAAQQAIDALELYSDATTWAARHPGTPGVASKTRFQSPQVGRLTSLSDPDVVVLRGSHLYRQAAIASQDRVQLLATGVISFAIVPGVGSGGLDQLVSTNASGLSKWSLSNGQLVAAVQPLSGWSNATGLTVGSPSQGTYTIYGIDSAGTGIKRARTSALKLTGASNLGGSALSGTITQLAPMFFDTGSIEDLAILTSTNVYVRSTDTGSNLWTMPVYTNNLIAVSRGTSPERDILLWSFNVGAANYLGYKFQGSPDYLLDINGLCTSLASFDISSQGGQSVPRNDIVLCLAGGRDAYVLQRLAPGGPGYFALPEPAGTAPYRCDLSRALNVDEDPDPVAPTYPTAIGGGDVDGDSDQDLVFAIHDHDEVRVFQNSLVERLNFAPSPTYSTSAANGIDWTNPAHPMMSLSWQVGSLPFTPDAVEVEARYQALVNGVYDPTAPAVLLSQPTIVPFSNSGGVLTMDLAGASQSHVLQFSLRYVRSTGTPSKGPALTVVNANGLAAVSWTSVPDVKEYLPDPNAPEAATLGGGFTLGGRGPGQPTP